LCSTTSDWRSRGFCYLGPVLRGILAMVSVSGVSCGSPSEPDRSLLTGEPCPAPCWHGVVPGESDEEEVRCALEDNPFVAQQSISRRVEEYDQLAVEYVVFYWRSTSGGENWIHLSDGVVVDVSLDVDYELTLGEIVKEFGAPEYLYGFIEGVERFNYLVWFGYPEQGLSFCSVTRNITVSDYLIPDRAGVGILPENLEVTEALYFAPTSLQRFLEEVGARPREMVDYLLDNAHEWQGFGTIELAPGL
jgi:hypothetical protein